MTLSSSSNSARVFLSYASDAVQNAERLRPLLKLAGFGPWLDSEALSTEEPWEVAMPNAITSSDFVVALLSPGTRNSRQEHELRAAVCDSQGKPSVLSCAVTGTRHAAFDDIAPDFLRQSHVLDFQDFEVGWQLLYESLYKAARMEGFWVPKLLRALPRRDLDHAAVARMIVKQRFFSRSLNARGGGEEAQLSLAPQDDMVVEDRSSGRMWIRGYLPSSSLPQAPHSTADEMTAEMFPASKRSDEQKVLVEARRDMKRRMRLAIEEWVTRVNLDRVGGYDDWRLPTLEEAMSLMSRDVRVKGLHISELFGDADYIRTADGSPGANFLDRFGEAEPGWGPIWIVGYADGDCLEVPEEAPIPLRFVRTDLD
jgi:hypothetical protein